jgi:tetratricopeptide (TPR) repeat protein
LGDFEICEPCYRQGLPVFFSQADLAEIHFRFGLEYCELGRWSDSVEALSRALQIAESADTLVALGLAEEKQGNRETAVSHYHRALEIDPAHPGARESLQKVDTQAA